MSSKQYYQLLLLKHCVNLYYVPSFQIFTFEFHIRFSILVRIAIKLTRRLGHIAHPFQKWHKAAHLSLVSPPNFKARYKYTRVLASHRSVSVG